MERWEKGDVKRLILEIVQTEAFAEWYGGAKLKKYRMATGPNDKLKSELLDEIGDVFRLERRQSPE